MADRVPPSRRLPLSVIGGFLGAGKTTLLNRWLRDAGGERIAVLVNDFGALNIDAELIERANGDAIALTNGCVCCQIGDDLSRALLQVLDSRASFDRVVIEASGVSDPWRIAQLGLADPGLSLDSVIVLVDADAVLDQARDARLADTLERQLHGADLVVINKTDRVDAVRLAQVRDWVAQMASATPRFETTQAWLPPALLGGFDFPHGAPDAAPPAGDAHLHGHDPAHAHADDGAHDCDHDHDHDHDPAQPDHGALFDTWSCRPPQALPAAALRDWLRAPPAGLLRLKGWVLTGPDEWAQIQFAGRHGSLRRAAPPQSGQPAVVAIGLRGMLPVAALESRFSPAT